MPLPMFPCANPAFMALLTTVLPAPGLHALEQSLPLHEADTVQAEFQVGAAGRVALSFKFADKKVQTLPGFVKADELKRTVEKDGKKVPVGMPMPDAFIEYRNAALFFRNHVRPNLQRYTEAKREDLVKAWDAMPSATQHWTRMEVRALDAGAELWMEGKFCGLLTSESKLTEVSFKLEDGGAVRGAKRFTRSNTGLFLPLEVKDIASPGAMKDAAISLNAGVQQVKSVPMIVGGGASNADVGVVKVMQGVRALETDENTSRTSLDGMRESLHFSVPQAFYHRAWVLCAVEDDPKKDAVLTTRLTRFGVSGRGGAIADTTLTLPRGGEKPGAGMAVVGSVSCSVDGKQITSPLYLVQVGLKAGEILDTLGEDAAQRGLDLGGARPPGGLLRTPAAGSRAERRA